MWSGGKDSAYALWQLREDPRYEVRALATMVTRGYDRTKWHQIRLALMHKQAEALGLPLLVIEMAPDKESSIEEHMAGIAAFFRSPEGAGFQAIGWGDIYWPEAKQQHQWVANEAGLEAVFPIWGWTTQDLAKAIIDAGFQATLVQVSTTKLDERFIGRQFDHQLLAELPEGVDPCGEEGEYQTFVTDGPGFRHPVAVTGERIARRGDAVYKDLLPA